MPTILDLPFCAAIPRGHDVLVVVFGNDNKEHTVVLDRTTTTLYCSDAVWGPLHSDVALATTDPIALLTRWTWTVKRAITATSGGALVCTTTWGDSRDMKTRLLLEEGTSAPYR